MAYDLRIAKTAEGVEISRSPGKLPIALGYAFQSAGVLFLLALPLATTQAGAGGLVSAGLCAAIGLFLGGLMRSARRVVRADRCRRRVTAAWESGRHTLPIDRHDVGVVTGMRLAGKLTSSATEIGPIHTWAVRLLHPGRSAPLSLIQTDSAADANEVLLRLSEALEVPHAPVPKNER